MNCSRVRSRRYWMPSAASCLRDDHFGGDAGVVGAGKPEGDVAAHAMPADGDVDFGMLQHVAHVEEPVTLGGGMTSENVGFPGFILRAIDAGFDPPLSPAGLKAPGLIDFFNFHGSFQFSRAREMTLRALSCAVRGRFARQAALGRRRMRDFVGRGGQRFRRGAIELDPQLVGHEGDFGHFEVVRRRAAARTSSVEKTKPLGVGAAGAW